MLIHPDIERTADGSHTLRHPLFGDLYHSDRGALGEAQHIYIRNGFDLCPLPSIRILEVGFGSGLNALLTLQSTEVQCKTVEYTAIELYPIDQQTAMKMDYGKSEPFCKLHQADWSSWQIITPNFRIKKIEADLVDIKFDTIFDLIYFDAFAPDTQPELWTQEVFEKLYTQTAIGGSLVTYSSKGDVKRAIRAAGYEVKRLQGALGKRHMLRATKI